MNNKEYEEIVGLKIVKLHNSIICVNNKDEEESLTIDKTYYIIDFVVFYDTIDNKWVFEFEVIDDENKLTSFDSHRFKLKD